MEVGHIGRHRNVPHNRGSEGTALGCLGEGWKVIFSKPNPVDRS